MKSYEELLDELLAAEFLYNTQVMELIDDALDSGDEEAFMELSGLLIVEEEETD